MNKIYLLLGSLSLLLFNSHTQTLNEPANWPNASWTLSGTYDGPSLLANPTTTDGNFSYDDDGSGSGSTDIIELESPVIDLTAASAAGESFIFIDYEYDYNLGNIFQFEYWDADAGAWLLWETLPDNSFSTGGYCAQLTGTQTTSQVLDVSGFTATQLSGFQYRVFYDASSVWGWGFCLSSPTIYSVACIAPNNLVANLVTGEDAEIQWTPNGSATEWNIEWGTPGFLPGTGAEDGAIAGTTNNPETITGLSALTSYDIYVQSDCGADVSTWVGPLNITTTSLCPDPSNLNELFTTAETIEFSWIENGVATEWNIEWGASGFAPGTGAEDGALVGTTNNPETITGLTPSTTYDIYVQTDCGTNGQSTWVGPLVVTTEDACSEPVNLTANILLATEVEFSWTEIGTSTVWNVEYGFAGFAPGTGAEEGVVSNTTNLTEIISGLTAGQAYDFYVQADCSGSPSGWSGPANVDLNYCSPTYSSTFEYMSLFETSLAVENVSYSAISQPVGGLEDLTSTDTLKAIEGSTFDFVTNYVGGGNVIRVWADFNNNLTYEPSEELYFQYQAGNPNNAHFGSMTIPGGTTPGSYNMRIRSEWGSAANPGPCTAETWGSAIDITLEVLPIPSCPSISDLLVSNVTSNSADLDWTAGGSEPEWIIEYDTTGFVPGTGTSTTVASTSESLTGLMDNTTYDVYVTAVCTPGDTAFTLGPIVFSTECNTFEAIDFCESFDSDSQTQSCWTVLNENADADSWNLDYAFNPNNGDEVAVINTDFNGGANDDWLISPQITLTGNEVMNFFYRVQNSGEPNDFEVLLSTTGRNPADFQDTLMFLNSYNNTEYLDSTVNLSAFTGDVYIAFHIPAGGLDGWILYFDDICFDVCVPASGTDGSEDICRADGTVDLNQLIVKGQENGEWIYPGNQQLIVDDSLFNVANLPTGEYDVLYIVEGGCTNDTTTASITLFPPSSAGENGTLSVCRNQPVDLFSGLNGNVDMGGTWYDPSDNAIPNSLPFSSNIQGSYNFDYIVSNGVCPADTQFVEVLVGSCDWLSIDEEQMTKIEVYPNPASDILNINNGSDMEQMTIEMFDMNGRLVFSDANSLSNANNTTISIDHLEKGIYTLRVGNHEGQKTFKIVKH